MKRALIEARLPTTRIFLDRLARKIADTEGRCTPVSDYRVAQVLGITNSAISRWRQNHGGMSDEIALKIAALLHEDERHVLACLQVERNRRNASVREAWMRVAMPGVVVPFVLIVLLFLSAGMGRGAEHFETVNTIHYAQLSRG